MKRLDKVILILIFLLVISGILYYANYENENIERQETFNNAVNSSVIYVKKQTSEEKETKRDEPTITPAIANDVLKSYTNVIDIPHLGIVASIGEGTSKNVLKKGVGRHTNTAELGQVGNCVIAGHSSTTLNCIFNGLENIKLMDKFYIYDNEGTRHTYYVTEIYTTVPTDMAVLSQYESEISKVTLYTCTEKGTMRFIVIGEEFDDARYNEYLISMRQDKQNYILDLNDSFIIPPLSRTLKGSYYNFGNSIQVKPINLGKPLEKTCRVIQSGISSSLIMDLSHEYDSKFEFDFGIMLKGGVKNDVSEG